MSNDTNSTEKQEVAKFKAKYPNMKNGPGSSLLLQNRMGRGQPRYFDSGDYQMAKAKGNIRGGVPILKPSALSDAAQTPKVANQVPDVAASVAPVRDEFILPTGMQIPTPESVSHRKPSLIKSNLVSDASEEL